MFEMSVSESCPSPETMLIGAQRIGGHKRIQRIVFGSRDAVAISETIELFRINREYAVVTLQEGLHKRTAWNLNGNCRSARFALRKFL